MMTNKMQLFLSCLFLVCCTCFGATPLPIIRRTKLHLQLQVLSTDIAGIVDETDLIHDTSHKQYRWTIPEAVNTVCAPDDGRRSHPKHVEQTRNKQIKNSCILLVVIYNYEIITCT
jgi:hypothetical protein